MNCIKCGKETAEGQVFCESCLESMQAYPIKPGTPVQILPRPAAQEKKPAARISEPSPAEQLSQLRGVIRWLTGIIAVLSILLCLTAVLLIRTLDKEPSTPAIGWNYTTTTGTKP